jgi:hypothetical protein
MTDNAIETLARRLPEHAATLRHLGARDPTFRAISKDYALALRALRHWQAASPAMPERVAEYRQMLEELEAEALAMLKVSGDK